MTRREAKNRTLNSVHDDRAFAGYRNPEAELKEERRRLIGIARDLVYPETVIDLLKAETNINRLTQIMTNARKGMYD